jgi:hypothetical protein
VGVVKRRVLRGLWRRLVGVGIVGPEALRAPDFIMPLAAHFGTSPPWRGLRFVPTRYKVLQVRLHGVVSQHKGDAPDGVYQIWYLALLQRGSF